MKEHHTEQINRERERQREKRNMCNRVCMKHEAERYIYKQYFNYRKENKILFIAHRIY